MLLINRFCEFDKRRIVEYFRRMSEATEQLRASLLEQQKKTEALIRSSKEIQKELRDALSAAEAALKEGESLQEKLKKEYPACSERPISDNDKKRIAKLLLVIEKEVGPPSDSSKLIELLEHDEVIETLSVGAPKKENLTSSAHSSMKSLKKGHIAL